MKWYLTREVHKEAEEDQTEGDNLRDHVVLVRFLEIWVLTVPWCIHHDAFKVSVNSGKNSMRWNTWEVFAPAEEWVGIKANTDCK